MKPATTYPGAARRRAPAGHRSAGAGGRGAARDAHPCPARLPRRRRSAGRQRRRHPARVAARPRRRRARRSRRGWSPRAATIASAPCCSAPATGTSAPRIARRPPRCRSARACSSARSPREIVARSPASPRLVELRFAADGRRAVGGALPRGAAGPVLVPRARSAAVGGADRLRRAPVGVRDAVGRAAAVVGDPARAPPQGRPLGVAHPRRRAERDRRSRRSTPRCRCPSATTSRPRPCAPWPRRARAAAASSRSGTTVVRALEGAAADGRRPARRRRRDRPRSSRPRSARASSTASCPAPTPRTRATSRCSPRSPAPTCSPPPPPTPTRAGFLTHELGDSMLVLPGALATAHAHPSASQNAR